MNGMVILIRGLPFSGKTKVAEKLKEELKKKEIHVIIIDQETIRKSLFPEIDYSYDNWNKIIERLNIITGILTKEGLNIIITTTVPKKEFVQIVREKNESFFEVFLALPSDVCKEKDTEEIFPDVEKSFEPSDFPDVKITSIEQVDDIIRRFEELGYIDVYDSDEEEEIKKRLQNLGYID